MTTVADSPVRTVRSTRHRDVFVVGTAGPAYTITDMLRDAGLSVGSVLVASAADALYARRQISDELDEPGAVQALRDAVVVSGWQHAGAGSAVDEVIHHRLYPARPTRPWIQLSPIPHRCGYVHPLLTAPLVPDRFGEQSFLPPTTRDVLVAQEDDELAVPGSPYARVLSVLLADLPTMPAFPHDPRCPLQGTE